MLINDLNKKLSGKLPVNSEELFFLISSWGREFSFNIDNDKIKKCEAKECYPLDNLDVSKITNMHSFFKASLYNGDLSNWDVENVINMKSMFAYSQFNGDISNWDVSNVQRMNSMFFDTKFNKDISKWNISNVLYFADAFCHSEFSGDISKWKFNEAVNCYDIFFKNKNFEKKYNNGISIPYKTNEFLTWFEENRMKIANLNVSIKEKSEIDDYLISFDKELDIIK